MPKQQKREYTPEQRQEALDLYREVGQAEAARRLHIPGKTIASWAKKAGIRLDAPPPAKVIAVETAKLTNQQRREAIVTKLYDRADRVLDRMVEAQTDYKGQQAREVVFDEASHEALNNYAKTVKELLDKAQLLSGEATSREETVSSDEVSAFLAGAAEQFRRQQEAAK